MQYGNGNDPEHSKILQQFYFKPWLDLTISTLASNIASQQSSNLAS